MAVHEDVFLQPGDALSVTDVQNDFLPGGALGVAGGDRIIPPLNRVIALFHKDNLPLFFTRDWHPPDHCSFQSQGGRWPPHCAQNTPGADFALGLNIPQSAVIISKGTQKDSEQYSTFYGRDAAGHPQSDLMKKFGVRRIFIAGLATDYCVLNSVKDALAAGHEVYVLADAVCAVDINPGDGRRAIEEMVRLGAKMTTTERIQGGK
ncbi:MAG: nicotinamidase [Syntrophus sp. (in: bacteria)]|nr:nicotinamidase [Syntrophus sp. (in: bacteria)]